MLLRGSRYVVAIVVVLGALLAPAVPASAKSPTPPARTIGLPRVTWSASKIEQGIGQVQLAHGRHRKDQLDEVIDVGLAAFDYGLRAGRAVDWVHSLNANGVPIDQATYRVEAEAPALAHRMPFAVAGGATHLDWTQAYDKRRRDANLRFKISDLKLDNIDDNGPRLLPAECPAAAQCDSIRAFVRYHLRAWVVAGGHEFFNVGGGIFGEGHQGAWLVGAATSVDSGQPFWTDATFNVSRDLENDHSGSHLNVRLATPIDLEVPLKNVPRNALFEVHMTMDAVAIDDRGRESAASARIDDPAHPGAGLVAHGLTARAAPSLKEPPVRPRPVARCPAGPRPRAGTLQLSSPVYTVDEANGTPLVLVKRVGGSRGATSAIIDTRSGTAVSGRDFTRTRTVVRFENGDTSPRLVEIPILEDRTTEQPENFTVSLAQPRCAQLGTQRSSEVTILDDDQPPPPPPPTFTIGGTVDGLQGSGLVLTNVGTEVPVSTNGSFTFPGTASDGEPYDISVKSQPRNPDQVCTVQNGAGHVTSANVSNIAVHCVTTPVPSGLDTTFGNGGRVTAPGVDAQAVLIQPDGRIVTVGPVDDGTFHFKFGATRHDAAGNLDPSFGTGGIVTTSFGGNDDMANDAALLPDGGFVAVGQVDPAGLGNTDFGIVRYTADGHPDPAFGTNGLVISDLTGRNDGANAVAVQPDGQILAAGFAETTPGHFFDFALVRYNPDGTLDRSFGNNGIVTTDFGSESEAATAVAIQPDGKIVAIGSSLQIGGLLARYNPDGTLDHTFGGGGKVISNVQAIGNGVAITPGGTILVAGTRGGPKGDDPSVASYAPNGSLNLGFGQGGVAQADLSGRDDFGEDLLVKPNGDITVVGSAASSTVTDMALVRFTPNGTLDTSLSADISGFGDFGHALAIDAQGRIVAAGGFALIRAFL